MRTTISTWATAVWLIALSGAPAHAAGGRPEWRDVLNCGPNCLYMLLSLQGKSVTYREVRAAVPVGPHGSSFHALKQAAARFGVDGAVVRCGVNELKLFLPAIVHMDLMDGGDGHFVLLLGATDTTFYTVETANAEVVPLPRAMFLKNWTGTAFVTKANRRSWSWPVVVGGLAPFAGVLAFTALRLGPPRGKAAGLERSVA